MTRERKARLRVADILVVTVLILVRDVPIGRALSLGSDALGSGWDVMM